MASSGPVTLKSPVGVLYGIGDKQAERLQKLGIECVADLVFHFPRRYEDYSTFVPIKQLQPEAMQTVQGTLWQIGNHRLRGRGTITRATVVDDSGVVGLTWFNQPYHKDNLASGQLLRVSGKVSRYRGQLTFNNPRYEVVESEQGESGQSDPLVGGIVPIYDETQGISSRWLAKRIRTALGLVKAQLTERLPAELVQSAGLLAFSDAVWQAHFPESSAQLKQARRRLSFEELFYWQLHALQRRQTWRQQHKSDPLKVVKPALQALRESLPFELTRAQRRVLNQILKDQTSPAPMARLLEGDVGAGKTVVAAFALLNVAVQQRQGVLMAPTEILAEQHFQTLTQLFAGQPVRVGLLTASKSLWFDPRGGAQIGLEENEEKHIQRLPKGELQRRLHEGEVDVVVGTHALLSEHVRFANLGLVIIDEQHRFGVAQRAHLVEQFGHPDVLVMTATPIPRTLALALFGELDLSVLDEKPAGRQPIVTRVVPEAKRPAAIDFVQRQLREGRQAFWICPLIEESETLEVTAATDLQAELQAGAFRDFSVGLLHGKLSAAEKQKSIEDFRTRRTHLLVSTSVVEVGVDVPNATVMLIEGAERFGLAQLHQFRGRVGRGGDQAYCLLFTTSKDKADSDRLKAFVQHDDGFKLAEEDLRIRGPGEVFGARQSGIPDLKMASLLDQDLLQEVRSAAEYWVEHLPGHPLLVEKVRQLEQHPTIWH